MLVRISDKDPRTIDYVNRRTAQGDSKRGSIRCLKRYVAREVYQALQHPQPTTVISTLRQRRKAAGMPMKAVAQHLNLPINAIARLERGIVHDTDLATCYHAWLDTHSAA